jgi:hypothetical protein
VTSLIENKTKQFSLCKREIEGSNKIKIQDYKKMFSTPLELTTDITIIEMIGLLKLFDKLRVTQLK